MRYSKEHKAETRQRILIQATRHFLEDGIAATGIAGLMAEAGLTHGGFYAHFSSKDELVAEAIGSGFRHTRAGLRRRAAESGSEPLEAVIRLYLSARHRDLPAKGCIAASLSPEVARLPQGVRESFTTEVSELLQLIAELLPHPPGRKRFTKAERQNRALQILAGMMGSLQLARAVSDQKLSDRALASGIDGALKLAHIA